MNVQRGRTSAIGQLGARIQLVDMFVTVRKDTGKQRAGNVKVMNTVY